MYFPDLSIYSYMQQPPDANLLTIGWLDDTHPFPKGPVPDWCLQQVLARCFKPINQTRGFHQSPFLPSHQLGYPVELEGKKMLLGSAEIRVPGRDNRVYAAPNLIFHYIKDCGYLPPQEFLDALHQEIIR